MTRIALGKTGLSVHPLVFGILPPGPFQTISIDTDNCILCGYCAPACPDFLIRVVSALFTVYLLWTASGN
jgi:ferredoxin